MASKYRLLERGVQDVETGRIIPEAEGNADWIEYQGWVRSGNIPDPVVVRVPDASALLGETDVRMIRAIDFILEILVQKGILSVNEIPPVLKQLYQERKALRGQ